MTGVQNILWNMLLKWRMLRLTEIALISFGVAALAYFIGSNFWIAVASFLLTAILGLLWSKPWQFGLPEVCSYLDNSVTALEHSTSLLLVPQEELGLLAKIQQARIREILAANKVNIRLKHQLVGSFVIGLVCAGVGAALQYSGIITFSETQGASIPEKEIIMFQPLDTVKAKVLPPLINQQKIVVDYPEYTEMAAFSTTDMNVKILQGSSVRWVIGFDQPIKEAWLQFGAEDIAMNFNAGRYQKSMQADDSAFYTLKFLDSLGKGYLSDLYAFEVYADEGPTVTMNDLPQYATFEYNHTQEFEFTTNITDDFGIFDVAIIATVSKGTGESVKFREEKLVFDTPYEKAAKSIELRKKMDLKALKMEAGDELYFYVEVRDNKEPKPNITRTETYFAVIRDTLTDGYGVEGTMGADLMPDYFRSQRQLIIDTEKLIAEKSILKKQDFNFRSNELGFDQKALRIRYGEFMGDETERPAAPKGIGEVDGPGDLLDDYSHKHDTDNEHNLVAEQVHDHGKAEDQGKGGIPEEDPLEAYVHNHGDPEASTLFAKSLKTMLKDAMAEMWDAELYLRLFEPEKSLPYQYKALKLIQEIKNSARIYVHRIGFDPPPIKENTRLTGKLEDIKGFSKTEEVQREELYPNMVQALSILELVLSGKMELSLTEKIILKRAGDELAVLAIVEPSSHLNTLQGLKWLSESQQTDIQKVSLVHAGLQKALPMQKLVPSGAEHYQGVLNQLFLEAFDANE